MTETAAAVPPLPPVKYGKFTHRMLAATLDLGAVFIVFLPMIDYAMMHLFPPVDSDRIMAVFNTPDFRNDAAIMISRLWNVLREQHVIARMFAENFLQMVFIAAYVLPFWMFFSATPGKMLFRLVVLDEKTLLPMSKRQCVGRFLAYLASGFPLSIGFGWIALNRRRKGFHDYLARTVVVVKPRKIAQAKDQLSSSI